MKGMNSPASGSLLFSLLLVFLVWPEAFPQGGTRKLDVNGYVKYMQSVNVVKGMDSLWIDNLFHNRVNFNWYPHENLKANLELRNRVFYGDLVRLIPGYINLVDVYNDYFDLSVNIADQSNMAIHSMIDRLYVQWTKDKFELTAGRQRINWGINTAWNPNDIFNAYSFFDFDYEERPGTDGIRLQYYTGYAASVELAAKIASRFEDWVAGGLWKFNRFNYDFQVLGGVMEGDFVAGGGWSGNITDAGFKGEFSYFQPIVDKRERKEVFTGSAAFDYMFSNSLYLNASYLFNSGAESGQNLDLFDFAGERLSAKNLLPFRHSFFLQGQYPFSPLVNAGLAAMYFPGKTGGIFANPNLSLSLAENWDLDLIGQIYYARMNHDWLSAAKYFYWRVKWSF